MDRDGPIFGHASHPCPEVKSRISTPLGISRTGLSDSEEDLSRAVIFPVTESQSNASGMARFGGIQAPGKGTFYCDVQPPTAAGDRSESDRDRDFCPPDDAADWRPHQEQVHGPCSHCGLTAVRHDARRNSETCPSFILTTCPPGIGRHHFEAPIPLGVRINLNCGSPIETRRGLLLFTTAGASSQLFDRSSATRQGRSFKVCARPPSPSLRPRLPPSRRLLPTMVYTCGAMRAQYQYLAVIRCLTRFPNFATIDIHRF